MYTLMRDVCRWRICTLTHSVKQAPNNPRLESALMAVVHPAVINEEHTTESTCLTLGHLWRQFLFRRFRLRNEPTHSALLASSFNVYFPVCLVHTPHSGSHFLGFV